MISFAQASPLVENCLFSGNIAGQAGGAVGLQQEGVITIVNGTMADNEAPDGSGLFVWNSVCEAVNTIIAFNDGGEAVHLYEAASAAFTYSDIHGNAGGDWTGDIAGQLGQDGNISEDPLFASGDLGDHYLGQTAAGQPADSPCVDAGDPAGDMIQGTTRTDNEPDAGIVDMGFHAPTEGGGPEPV
jgi:hypothetical protein